MKKLVIYFAFIVGLSNCKSFDPSLLQPGDFILEQKLPAMEKQIENNYVFLVSPGGEFYGPNPQDVSTLFDKELSEKIMDPYTNKKGYIVLKINTYKNKVSPGPAIFIPLIGIFVGLPTGLGKSNIEVQLDVLNLNRRLIGSYTGSAQMKMNSSLYKNNFNSPGLSRTMYITTVRTALQEAKKKLAADSKRLISSLE